MSGRQKAAWAPAAAVGPVRITTPLRSREAAALRQRLAEAIERAIAALDALDGDPDLEPVLGAPERPLYAHLPAGRRCAPHDQARWGAGGDVGEREDVSEDEGAACEDEGGQDEREPCDDDGESTGTGSVDRPTDRPSTFAALTAVVTAAAPHRAAMFTRAPSAHRNRKVGR